MLKKISTLACAFGLMTTLQGCGVGDSVQAQSSPSTLATKDLSAFVNTYWYVPTDYLLEHNGENCLLKKLH